MALQTEDGDTDALAHRVVNLARSWGDSGRLVPELVRDVVCSERVSSEAFPVSRQFTAKYNFTQAFGHNC